MDDFLGMGMIIKEQRKRIEFLEFENRLLFEHLRGNDDDLARFNRAMEEAVAQHKQSKQ